MDFTESNIIPAVEPESIPEDFSMLDDAVIDATTVVASPGELSAEINDGLGDTDELDTIDEEGRERTESDGKRMRERKGSREGRERKDSRERKRSLEQMDGLDDAAGKIVNSVLETAVDLVNKNEDEFKSVDPSVEFVAEPGFRSWGNVMGQEPSFVPESVTEEFSMLEKEKNRVGDEHKYVSLKDEDGMDSFQSETQLQPQFDAWNRIIDAPSADFTSDFQIESHSDIEIESRTTFESNTTTESYSDDEGIVALEEETAYLAGVGFSEVKIERTSPEDVNDIDIHWKKGHTKHKYEGEERMAEPYMDDMRASFRRGDSLHFDTFDMVDDETQEDVVPDTPRAGLDEYLLNDSCNLLITDVGPSEPVPEVEPSDPVLEVEPSEPVLEVEPSEPVLEVEPSEPVPEVEPSEPCPAVEFADVMIERATPKDDHVEHHWKKERTKHRYEGEVRAEPYLDEDMKIDENYCEDHESVVVLSPAVEVVTSTEQEDGTPGVMFAEVTVTSSKPDEHPDLHWKKERTKHRYEGETKCEPEPITSEPIVNDPEPEISTDPTPEVMFADVTITRSVPNVPDTDIHWKKERTKHKYEGEVKCEPLSKEDLKEAIKDIAQDDIELSVKTLLFHILAVIISITILTLFYPDLDENLSLPCVISCIAYFSLCVYNDAANRAPSPSYKIWMFDVFSYIVLPLAIGSSILELSEMYFQAEGAADADVFIISSVVSSLLCLVEVVLLKFSVDYKMLPLCVVFPVCSNFFIKRWMEGEEPEILVEI